ncbi:LacI family DNA-binding transcriptional regulator [Leuconostoc mesenteroides]|uniref:LacI family DNA-binding transcriptional regulator n=1 Tax=Leuconostoc mesenteroides TaxID=1245 RepID=UPI002072C7DB|nr:LacI family DNA-binding transcriptional regulator [Leuconostoc mesenteroides]MCM6830499.1 LacI family DNA-binding transcriptional regulator [Leuconostoc mesenteroides]
MTTIKEIALKTGYSSATVSRILNNDQTFSVTDSTRETVQTVARQLDYISVGSNQFLDIITGNHHERFFSSLQGSVNSCNLPKIQIPSKSYLHIEYLYFLE